MGLREWNVFAARDILRAEKARKYRFLRKLDPLSSQFVSVPRPSGPVQLPVVRVYLRTYTGKLSERWEVGLYQNTGLGLVDFKSIRMDCL